jgi:hypothetical protein
MPLEPTPRFLDSLDDLPAIERDLYEPDPSGEGFRLHPLAAELIGAQEAEVARLERLIERRDGRLRQMRAEIAMADAVRAAGVAAPFVRSVTAMLCQEWGAQLQVIEREDACDVRLVGRHGSTTLPEAVLAWSRTPEAVAFMPPRSRTLGGPAHDAIRRALH